MLSPKEWKDRPVQVMTREHIAEIAYYIGVQPETLRRQIRDGMYDKMVLEPKKGKNAVA